MSERLTAEEFAAVAHAIPVNAEKLLTADRAAILDERNRWQMEAEEANDIAGDLKRLLAERDAQVAVLRGALDSLRDAKVSVVEGVEGISLYINDFRVKGPKPWGGGEFLYDVEHVDLTEGIRGAALAEPPAPTEPSE